MNTRSISVAFLFAVLLAAAGCPKKTERTKSEGEKSKTPLKPPPIAKEAESDKIIAALKEHGGNLDKALDAAASTLDRNAQTRRIEYLNFEDVPITAEGLKQLLPLKDTLKRIDLTHTGINDEALQTVAEFTELTKVLLNQTPITDDGLAHLKKLTNLTELSLRGTKVGDAGMEHLGALQKLTMLNLSWTKVSDAGLSHVGQLKNLDTLLIQDTQITDDGLKHLQGLNNLRHLYVTGTTVTTSGVQEIRRLLPKVDVRGP